MKNTILVSVLLALVVALTGLLTVSAQDRPKRTAWEYEVISLSEFELKEKGRDGWEACGVYSGESPGQSRVLLKRPLLAKTP